MLPRENGRLPRANTCQHTHTLVSTHGEVEFSKSGSWVAGTGGSSLSISLGPRMSKATACGLGLRGSLVIRQFSDLRSPQAPTAHNRGFEGNHSRRRVAAAPVLNDVRIGDDGAFECRFRKALLTSTTSRHSPRVQQHTRASRVNGSALSRCGAMQHASCTSGMG